MTDLHNFNLRIMEAGYTKALEDKAVFTSIANNKFTGQINQKNDVVKMIQVGPITINAYTGSVTTQSLSDAQREIIADQDGYFSFDLDTLEFNNVKSGLTSQAMSNAAYASNNSIDEYLAGLYAQAGIVQNTNASPVNLTSENIQDEFLEMAERFAEAGIPRNQPKAMLVPPWVITKLALDATAVRTDNIAVYGSGYIGTAHGWDFVESNNVSKNSSSWDKTRLMCIIVGQSYGYAAAVSTLETHPDHDQIGVTVTNGRFVYGGKIVRPDMTGVLYANKTAEA